MTLPQFLVIFFGPVAVLAVVGAIAWAAGRKRLPERPPVSRPPA